MIAGSAAGALIGLLFVAVSIRIEVIAASAELGLFALTSLLLASTGLLLILGIEHGLYVLVLIVIVAMIGGITSAWLFLTKITD